MKSQKPYVRSPKKRTEKPLIAMELCELPGGVDELLRLAEDFGWQIYDLSINRFYLPTNPYPSGAIISKKGGSTTDGHEDRVFDFPTVRLGSVGRKIQKIYPLILSDRYAAGKTAVDHLADIGFKDIVIFLKHDWEEAEVCYKGAFERAEELGITFHRFWLLPKSGEAPEDKLHRWTQEQKEHLAELPKPFACLCSNDYLGARFCFDCQSYGLSVPEDVAVLCVGNQERVCRTAPVTLSSVDMDHTAAIREAAQLLKRMLDGDPPPDTPIIVPPRGVVVRRSTDLLAASDPRVARALRFMWDHLDWPITIDDVCREAGSSRRTLARLFKKSFGRGIHQELLRKRLERCCELLLNTEMSVAEISLAVGFPSPPHLHRTFLKTYGLSPGKFRTQAKA